MNKRKVDSAAYTGSDTFGSNLEATVTSWGSNVTTHVAGESRSGVTSNWVARPAADVANRAQPVDTTYWGPNVTSDVARELRSGVIANWEPRPTTDVANRVQPVGTATWGSGVTTN